MRKCEGLHKRFTKHKAKQPPAHSLLPSLPPSLLTCWVSDMKQSVSQPKCGTPVLASMLPSIPY